MITEDYVSFEVAKLLKKKGFDEECVSVYHDGKLQLVSSLGVFCGEGYGEQILTYTNSECEWSPIMISAPTLQMTMKWLREVHNLLVVVDRNEDYYVWQLEDNKTGLSPEKTKMTIGENNSYEKACEAGIKYCLENLI